MKKIKMPVRLQLEGFLNTPSISSDKELAGFPLFHTSMGTTANFQEVPPPPTGVLGKRAEYFFRYWIDRKGDYRVLAHNVQIIEQGRTLGELDFLLQEIATRDVLHIELVYKFYLYLPLEDEEENRWIGPNRKDSLQRKLDRLRRQQFPLLCHPATGEFLDRLGLDASGIKQKLCFKASLFLPWRQTERIKSPINPAAVKGFWISFRDFTGKYFGQDLFFSPAKPNWPVSPEESLQWMDFTSFLDAATVYLESKRSLLVWRRDPHGTFSRFFLVWW